MAQESRPGFDALFAEMRDACGDVRAEIYSFSSSIDGSKAINRLAQAGLESMVLKRGVPALQANAEDYAAEFGIELSVPTLTTGIEASNHAKHLSICIGYETPALKGLHKFSYLRDHFVIVSTVRLPYGGSHAWRHDERFSYEYLDVESLTTPPQKVAEAIIRLGADIFAQRTPLK